MAVQESPLEPGSLVIVPWDSTPFVTWTLLESPPMLMRWVMNMFVMRSSKRFLWILWAPMTGQFS